jgi:phenylpyruvate tautomerase PptA (4-oxalocrotonate tautomerase family)
MPVLTLTVILAAQERLPENTAATVAHAAARVFNSEPGQTWVRLNCLSSWQYAEDGDESGETAKPVFVSVLKARADGEAQRRAEAARLSAAIANALGRPADLVHILYEPPALGRVAFGGKLLGP